jgi:peptidoglycan L-alanyl-D-glutamate endopeptidase CwlK
MALSKRDRERLAGVDPRLVRLFEAVGKDPTVDFIVTEGLRTRERQAELVAKGASTTFSSRHLDGRAVDIAVRIGGKITWEFEAYRRFAAVVKRHAADLGVVIQWGGDWRTFKDGPHFQVT